MALWKDQTPGQTILSFNVSLRDNLYTVEIDVPEISAPARRMYRLTIGTMWEYREVERSDDLERIVKSAYSFANANTLLEARKAIGAA